MSVNVNDDLALVSYSMVDSVFLRSNLNNYIAFVSFIVQLKTQNFQGFNYCPVLVTGSVEISACLIINIRLVLIYFYMIQTLLKVFDHLNNAKYWV